MTDKPTPTTDLLKRCAEIHEWRSTGVLSGEALRDYAKRKWPDRHDTLQMAEHETVTEALALLAKWGQPSPAPLSESIDQIERALAIIGVVGAIDGHDVVRRESVLEIARRAALAAQGGK